MKLTRRHFLGFMGAACVAGCNSARESLARVDLVPGGKDSFTFATMNDLHVTDSKSTGIILKAVASMNKNPDVQFTVVLGDLATDGELSELRLVNNSLAGLKKPWAAVPGNHDMHPKISDLSNYRSVYGEAHWREAQESWLFIGVNSCEGTQSNVTVSEEELYWLKDIANRTNKERPIALFAHHPFNPNTKAYRVRNADDVLGIFSGHNLKLAASGHFHGNQIEEAGGAMFTTTACCSTTRGNHDGTEEKGYRLYHVGLDSISTEFVAVEA